jgi:guanylate kinase
MNNIILVGKAASGKDHMRKILQGRGFKYGVSYTTRPKRKNEIDGEDYYFVSETEFKGGIMHDTWYEWVEFNGWYYGTTKKQFLEDCNIFIMTPKGITHINPVDRKNCTIFYLDISDTTRSARLSQRGDNNDSIERRMSADDRDFKDFNDYDIKINNSNF